MPGKSGVPLPSPLNLSNFKQFLILSLSFMALTFLKSTDELFCRLSLNVNLSNGFMTLEWLCFFAKNALKMI